MSTNGIVNIRGKQYKTVARRVNDFRAAHPISEGWGIHSSLVEADGKCVIFRAEIVDPTGRVVGVGYAQEQVTARGINATSALECCETSAIGRALSACGFGGSEYASADEVAQAISSSRQQQSRQQQSRQHNAKQKQRQQSRQDAPTWSRHMWDDTSAGPAAGDEEQPWDGKQPRGDEQPWDGRQPRGDEQPRRHKRGQ